MIVNCRWNDAAERARKETETSHAQGRDQAENQRDRHRRVGQSRRHRQPTTWRPASAFSTICSISWRKHSLIDITVRAKGDLHIDFHHTAEDVGIALGEAVKQALGDKKGIRRYASSDLVMDGTLTRVALDVSRPAVPRLEGRVQPRQGRRDGYRTVPRVVPGLCDERRDHAARRKSLRRQQPPHRRIGVQGAGPGAARRRRDRSARRRPRSRSTKGTL